MVQQQVGYSGEGEDDLQVRYTPAVLNVLVMCFLFCNWQLFITKFCEFKNIQDFDLPPPEYCTTKCGEQMVMLCGGLTVHPEFVEYCTVRCGSEM